MYVHVYTCVVCVCVCVCVGIHHIFFIYSSVDGYLGCFHILATLNSAAMNIRVYVSFQISVLIYYFFDIYLRV